MNAKQIQHLLAYLGYYQGVIDGILGGGSKAAISCFQADAGLREDGICGALTQAALKEAVASDKLKPADSGLEEISSSTGDDFWADIPHFSRTEFKCKCGSKYCNGYPVEPSEALVLAAEKVRTHFGKAVTISSGIRCKTHNANVGGVANSRHLTGKAMDFCVSGVSGSAVDSFVASLPEIKYHYVISGEYVHMNV